MAIGGGASAGFGGFYSNADSGSDLKGHFDSHMLGLGPLGSVEFDYGHNDQRRLIYIISVSPGFLGKGLLLGYAHFKTYTPECTIHEWYGKPWDLKNLPPGFDRYLY